MAFDGRKNIVEISDDEKTIYFDFPKPGDGKPAEASLQTSNAALRSIDRALKLD